MRKIGKTTTRNEENRRKRIFSTTFETRHGDAPLRTFPTTVVKNDANRKINEQK